MKFKLEIDRKHEPCVYGCGRRGYGRNIHGQPACFQCIVSRAPLDVASEDNERADEQELAAHGGRVVR